MRSVENCGFFCQIRSYVKTNFDVCSCHSAVWKFHEFCITQILREIKFEESRSSKCRFCQIWGSGVSSFAKFQPSKSAKIHKKSKFRTSKCGKMANFAL